MIVANHQIDHRQYSMRYTEGATIVTLPPSIKQLQGLFSSCETTERVIQRDVPVGVVQCGVIAEAAA